MKSLLWQQIEMLFQAAVELPPAERESYLERVCEDNPDLRNKLRERLAVYEQAGTLHSVRSESLPSKGPAQFSLTGRILSHYAVADCLGRGGMGVVYKAYDNRLHRTVALKALPLEFVIVEERKRRFIQEARAASVLNHPNIVTIHDIDSADGVSFIVMELVDGVTLAELMRNRRLEIPEVIDFALQIADALASTHARGIVHRDLKPANIMVTKTGHLKILDFGLAKLVEGPVAEDATTRTALTETGMIVGTAAYMSPEQISGGSVDSRSDIFSFGALLYEMITGRRAFQSENTVSLIAAILHAEPDPINRTRQEVPPELEAVVSRCLRKAPEQRFAAMNEVMNVLTPLKASRTRISESDVPSTRSRQLARVASAVVVVALIGTIGWFWKTSQRTAWAYGQVPEIRRLVASYDYKKALALTEEAKAFIPNDTEFARLLSDTSWESSVNSVPAEARVSVRPYGSSESDWQELGQTPLAGIRIPRGALEWKVSKAGYQEAHLISNALIAKDAGMNVRLARSEEVPEGMVFVPGLDRYNLSLDGLTYIQGVTVRDFYLDRFEVTNQQFKKFVDAGGYSRKEFWKERIIENGHEIPWEQAMEKFTDKTGQPGPRNWELRDFPAGQADFPVGGVSWYEAAAYAQFVGKILPPVAYWNRAARPELVPHLVIPRSNFSSTGPVASGKSTGMNPFGTYDMAGNVREWALNEAGKDSGQRYVLGGGWDDPIYQFGAQNAVSAFDRAPTNGIRLARYAGGIPGLTESEPLKPNRQDFNTRQIATDSEFKIYARQYRYEKTALNSTIENSWDEPYWTKQRISFDAAYNKERMVAYLFLPKSARPPYQTLVYFPGLGAQSYTNTENLEVEIFSALVRSGRAVIYPVYKGTYERGGGVPMLPGGMIHADLRVQQVKDLARSLDYLETRTDFDMNRVGFYGISWGGGMGAHIPAVEDRLKLNILVHGGFRSEPYEPHVDPINFVTRVKIPTLMLSGKYDFGFPVETNQLALFRLLGTPAADKVRIQYDIGHQFLPTEFAKASLAWLEKYFGPVNPIPVN